MIVLRCDYSRMTLTALQAIQPLRSDAAVSTSYVAPPNYNLMYQNSVSNVPKKKLKRHQVIPKTIPANQSVRCQVCNIECDTVQVYEKHLSGKKHAKGLLKLYGSAQQSEVMQTSQSIISKCTTSGGQNMPGVATKPVNLEVKRQKLLEGGAAVQSVRVCAICNVACNGEIAFADHLAGKKHAVQVIF